MIGTIQSVCCVRCGQEFAVGEPVRHLSSPRKPSPVVRFMHGQTGPFDHMDRAECSDRSVA